MNMIHKWKCMYTNANSIVGKIDELRQRISSTNYDIIAITESWAKDDVSDAELKIDGYLMYRKDKVVDSRVKGGGVLLYVNEKLRSHALHHLADDKFQDSVWCKIETDDRPVIVGVCYRSTSSTRQNNDNLLHLLEKVSHQGSQPRLLILGDFNFPEIDYVNYKVDGGPDTDANRFFIRTNDLFLHQHITYWTRCRAGQQPSILDYVFTDEDNVIEDITYSSPLGKSDHVCIDMNYIIGQQESETTQITYDFWKGDYVRIKEELRHIDWEQLLRNKGIDEAWTYFRSRIDSLVEAYVPLKKVHGRKKKKNEWITKATVTEIKKRDALWAKYRKFSSDRNYKAYKAVRNRVTKLIRTDKVNYQRKLAVSFRSNPKRFYGYIRRMQTVKDKVMGLKKADGQQTVTDQETADVFCNYFSEVFVTEGNWNDDTMQHQTENISVEITETKVKKLLSVLKTDKSPGPDGIHPLFLHNTAEEVAKPLTLIFNKSFTEGELPHDWKRANISPIYKKGARNEAGNYRPVSLTSVACKLLEAIVKQAVVQFLEDNQHITSKQHGFVSGRSCLTNLLESFESWTEFLDEGYGIDVIYLDYRKAFDTVPHKRLLTKIYEAGIRGKVFHWIRAFLCDREMRVVVNKQSSVWSPVISGVPQGSVLGPLLFLLYVNDLPDWIKNDMRMFADDTKLWSKINRPQDYVKLQDDLNQLHLWSDKWLLSFNPEKCKVMHIGHNYRFVYTIQQKNTTYKLSDTAQERDLGVLVINNLNVSTQCAEELRQQRKQ